MSQKKVWDEEWPRESLEHLWSCPVCKQAGSKLLLGDIVDNAFFTAPGRWKLYQCQHCKSAYLNPRPDPKNINKAYGIYYTHEGSVGSSGPTGNSGFIQRFRQLLLNGYYNYHHGTKREPSIRLGALLLLFHPKFRKSANARFRYLNKPNTCQKLLDVGCGNGDFLSLASEAGWQVKGVEPDPKAFDVARARGFEVVQGSLEDILNTGELFDVITMSHVIEHVHDPVTFLKLAHKCLKPGGTIYIDTPNIQSSGVSRFGKNWRGIESPRHLVLFSELGLRMALKTAGFSHINFFSRRDVRENIALKSYRMEQGLSPYDDSLKKLPFKEALTCHVPRPYSKEEFLTLVARKD